QPTRLRCVKGVKEAVKTLLVKSGARILDGDEYFVRCMFSRSNEQFSRRIAYAFHRFDGVHDQVQGHLLQLDAISLNERQAAIQLGLYDNTVLHDFAARQGKNLKDSFV